MFLTRDTLNLTNLNGDIAATVDPATGDGAIATYTEYTEYGLPRDPATTGPGRYGWLGTHTRENMGITGGLTLMGARLYNPATGRFLTMDPIRGGNDNTYTYPVDPVNATDVDGMGLCGKWCKSVKKKAKKGWKKSKKAVKKRWKAAKKYVKKQGYRRMTLKIAKYSIPYSMLAKCALGGSYSVYRGDRGNTAVIVGDFLAGCL